jgi:copper(I)-binding protein
VLKPGGLHVMMIDLKAPLKEGDSVPITLTFDDGSSKQVDAKVLRATAVPAPTEHKQH